MIIARRKPRPSGCTNWKPKFVVLRYCQFESGFRRWVIWHRMETRMITMRGRVWREAKGA